MRWFKHNTTTRSDEKIARIFDHLGAEGYGVFWCILEEIARNLEGNQPTFLQLSAKNWGKTCGLSAGKFGKVARLLGEIEIFSVVFYQNEIRIDAPNLLKHRDEWSARKARSRDRLPSSSGETTARKEQNRTKENKEEENRTKENKETMPPGFDLFWETYPRKIDKSAAMKKYAARLKEGADPEEILTAVKKYLTTTKDPAFIRHPKTFLNDDWRQWLTVVAKKEEPMDPREAKAIAEGMDPDILAYHREYGW